MPKISVDKVKCIGCELCPDICPDSFEMEGDKAIPLKPEVDKVSDTQKEARDGCPTGAIIISD